MDFLPSGELDAGAVAEAFAERFGGPEPGRRAGEKDQQERTPDARGMKKRRMQQNEKQEEATEHKEWAKDAKRGRKKKRDEGDDRQAKAEKRAKGGRAQRDRSEGAAHVRSNIIDPASRLMGARGPP